MYMHRYQIYLYINNVDRITHTILQDAKPKENIKQIEAYIINAYQNIAECFFVKYNNVYICPKYVYLKAIKLPLFR